MVRQNMEGSQVVEKACHCRVVRKEKTKQTDFTRPQFSRLLLPNIAMGWDRAGLVECLLSMEL